MAKYKQTKNKLNKIYNNITQSEYDIDKLDKKHIYYNSINYKKNVEIYKTELITLEFMTADYINFSKFDNAWIQEDRFFVGSENIPVFRKLFIIDFINFSEDILSLINVSPIVETTVGNQNKDYVKDFYFRYSIVKNTTNNYKLYADLWIKSDVLYFEDKIWGKLLINFYENKSYYEIYTDKI